jgi:hypothetical protein
LNAADAFEDFEALFVVERDGGFSVDGQAIAPVVVAVVEREAAYGDEVPIAFGVVGVAHGGVEPGDVGQTLHAALAQGFCAKAAGLKGRLGQRQRPPACDAGGGCLAGVDHHRL